MADDALVTEAELDLTLVAPADRFLVIEVSIRGEATEEYPEGAYYLTEKRRVPLRGAVSVPQMTSFLRLETRINNALASDDQAADQALEQALEASQRTISDAISEKNHDLFAWHEREIDGVGRRVRARLELDVQQVLVVLSWLAGDVSVADAVAKAITGGTSGAKSAEELDRDDDSETDSGERSGGGGPLASSESSSSISSSSDASTAGGPDGGSSPEEPPTASHGESSAPTSSTPVTA